MSFRCSICNEAQPDHSTPIKLVTKTRPKIYPSRTAMIEGRTEVIDKGGKGFETVVEIPVCGRCSRV